MENQEISLREVVELHKQVLEVLRETLELLKQVKQPIYVAPYPQPIPAADPRHYTLPYSPFQQPNTVPNWPNGTITCKGPGLSGISESRGTCSNV